MLGVGLEAEVWLGRQTDKTNRSIKSRQGLNICISTESEPVKKELSIEGKLVWRVNERMHQAFAKAHSCLHSFGQSLGLLLEIADLFSHFFLSCRLLGSQALLQSGLDQHRMKSYMFITLLFLDLTVLLCLHAAIERPNKSAHLDVWFCHGIHMAWWLRSWARCWNLEGYHI